MQQAGFKNLVAVAEKRHYRPGGAVCRSEEYPDVLSREKLLLPYGKYPPYRSVDDRPLLLENDASVIVINPATVNFAAGIQIVEAIGKGGEIQFQPVPGRDGPFHAHGFVLAGNLIRNCTGDFISVRVCHIQFENTVAASQDGSWRLNVVAVADGAVRGVVVVRSEDETAVGPVQGVDIYVDYVTYI